MTKIISGCQQNAILDAITENFSNFSAKLAFQLPLLSWQSRGTQLSFAVDTQCIGEGTRTSVCEKGGSAGGGKQGMEGDRRGKETFPKAELRLKHWHSKNIRALAKIKFLRSCWKLRNLDPKHWQVTSLSHQVTHWWSNVTTRCCGSRTGFPTRTQRMFFFEWEKKGPQKMYAQKWTNKEIFKCWSQINEQVQSLKRRNIRLVQRPFFGLMWCEKNNENKLREISGDSTSTNAGFWFFYTTRDTHLSHLVHNLFPQVP